MADILGDEFNNNLPGTNNDDFIQGLGGSDTIDGGFGFLDRMFGGDGNDIITDADGVNGAHGGAGNDTLDITFAANWLSSLNQARSDGKITGGIGNDTITVTMNDPSFFISLKGDEPTSNIADGNDTITLLGSYANAVVDLGGGNDTFDGGIGRDNVSGGGGNDFINGNDGSDVLYGGLGFHDRLVGGDSNDVLSDLDGINTANGGLGSDTLDITFAANWLNPSNQARSDGRIVAGYGNDIITVTMNNASFFISLKADESGNNIADGNDTVTLQGSYGNAVANLGGGFDIFNGGVGRDNVNGGSGGDTINGYEGNDSLNGGVGSDVLIGGLDNDTLIGASGADIFVFGVGEGADIINDFQNGQDLIGLSGGLMYSDLTISGSGTNTLITLTSSNELLATLLNINSTLITGSDFTAI